MSDDVILDSGPARILVIDDDDTNRYVLAAWLRRAGHTVIDASDGAEGLALLALTDVALPEAVIADVRLPDMSGFEVSEAIKADPRTAGVPVIHVSAAAITPEEHAEGLRRGADAYLNQPVDPGELLATVTAALRYARARRRAERLASRLATLNRTTLEVYKAVGFHSFAAAAAGGAAALMASSVTAVFLTPLGQPVRCGTTAAGGVPHLMPTHSELLSRLTGYVLGNGTGSEIADLPQTQWEALLPTDHLKGDVVLAVARTKRGRPPVCLAVPADAVRESTDRELLQQLAHACALSLEALRTYNEEHALALALQRTFLPDHLPAVGGVDLAFRYLPASAHAEIGGDFYEAIQTADGLLLAIGDVAGHSLSAAVVMGEVRHALRAYALDDHPPHQILERLEVLLAHSQPGVTVTLCLALIEPGGRRVHIANAGHIPPLFVRPDGRARFVSDHGAILGLRLPHPPSTVCDTEPGTRIVLLTDGLVEQRTVNLGDSLAAFLGAVESGPTDVEGMCDFLLETFGQDKEDDIALLTARLR